MGEIVAKFTLSHSNINVYDLEKSLEFAKPRRPQEVRRRKSDDGSFGLVFLTDCAVSHQIWAL